jgi:DNA-binding transcriptional ArsR family regulator
MDVKLSMAAVGALVGVPARASILAVLFDGRALTATELAYVAGVSPQTTSSHLAKLLDARLIVAEMHGRHRYYRLAGADIAEALEPLALIAHKPVPARSRSRELETLRDARMCYDHLAGRLGVAIATALIQQKQLKSVDRDLRVTRSGAGFFQSKLGIDLDRLRSERRIFARECLDWSERQSHLAGALGAALAATFLNRGWITRAKRGRQIIVSQSGKDALADLFSMTLEH